MSSSGRIWLIFPPLAASAIMHVFRSICPGLRISSLTSGGALDGQVTEGDRILILRGGEPVGSVFMWNALVAAEGEICAISTESGRTLVTVLEISAGRAPAGAGLATLTLLSDLFHDVIKNNYLSDRRQGISRMAEELPAWLGSWRRFDPRRESRMERGSDALIRTLDAMLGEHDAKQKALLRERLIDRVESVYGETRKFVRTLD